jgi:spore coat protein U-like protein
MVGLRVAHFDVMATAHSAARMNRVGAGNSGDVTNRAMTGGTPSLPYNIYTSGSYTTVWDNTTGVSGSVLLSGPLGAPLLVSGSDTKTVFGRILASQPV